jgi:hypothetical protein
MKKKIGYCDGLKNSKPSKIEYEELEKKLLAKYNRSSKRGQNFYEFFDLTKKDFKLYFDIDDKIELSLLDDFKDDEYINIYKDFLKKIFGLEDYDIFLSCDNREYFDKKEEKKMFKISYHIVIDRKTNEKQIKEIVEKLNKLLDEYNTKTSQKFKLKLDENVYHKLQKFRTLYSKKDNDKNSLLIPLNNNDKLQDHLIQILTDDICDIDTEKLNEKMNDIKDKKNEKIEDKSIKELLKDYDIQSTKEEINCKFHIIKKGFKCPFLKRVHTNNHNYLVETNDTLYLKCFSENCKGKVEVLYNNIDTNTLEFNPDVFNSIKIKNGSDYEEKRTYFEKHYKYFVDSDTFNRVKMKYNKKNDYYDNLLVEVKKNGLGHLNFYKINEGEKTPKKYSFIKEYSFDNKRTNLFDMIFDPTNNDKNYYNLFDGFNYSKVLNKGDEITNEDKENLQFLLNFLKKNVCENNKKFLDFFLSHLALIIQNPSFLNHMIFLLYSSKEGTGKSQFLKFFSKVIGQKYSYFGSYSQILEKHSTSALGKFINIIEEVEMVKSKKFTEDMKNLSQREQFVYNGKNKVETILDCFVRYFGTTNNNNGVSIPKNNRRYIVYEFLKILDDFIINKLDRLYEDKKMIYLFGDYLKNYPIKFKTRKDWINNIPQTECYKLFIYSDSVSSFLKDLYNKRDYFDEDIKVRNIKNKLIKDELDVIKMKTKIFYNYYKDYCMECNLNPFGKVNFYKNIKTNYKSIIGGVKNSADFFLINLRYINTHFKIDKEYINNYI